jgi:hypothetical protein
MRPLIERVYDDVKHCAVQYIKIPCIPFVAPVSSLSTTAPGWYERRMHFVPRKAEDAQLSNRRKAANHALRWTTIPLPNFETLVMGNTTLLQFA